MRAAYLLRVMSRLGAAAKPTKQQQQAAKRARTNKSEEPDTTGREPAATATKEYKSREIIEDDDRYGMQKALTVSDPYSFDPDPAF